MYNASATYEENYKNGPDSRFLKEGRFPFVKYTEKPRYEFLGVPLHLPFGVAAGPLLNASYVKAALNAGFCLPVYKTVRSRAWECNKWPNVLSINSKQKSIFSNDQNDVIGSPFQNKDYFSKSISISNSFGVPSQAPDVWKKDFLSLNEKQILGSGVVLSFQGSREEMSSSKETKEAFYLDIKKTIRLALDCIKNSPSTILEINLSCPNEVHSPLYKDLPSALKAIQCAHQVLSEEKSDVKLVAKIGALSPEETRKFISETAGMLHAISAINTVSANIRNINSKIALGSGSLSGGVCGSLIFDQGISMVSSLAEIRSKLGIHPNQLGIIGVGGVVSVKEFQSYLSAGADIVQAATGMMWNLNLASEVAESLQVPYEKIEEMPS
ncbi:hypothetical protein [Silvanigrella sp.]|jgi:dihydroorotate dehydrogenase (NAD+) catalytic subunit|uniref:hypothetical protein n=1 Tax=Silvanigrella sp. TaxID=2024976 RepID=UPI0037C553DB